MVVQDNSLCLVFLMNLKKEGRVFSIMPFATIWCMQIKNCFFFIPILIFTAGKGSGRPTEVNENDE